MPTYNYYCDKCDFHFSYFQNMNESPKQKCEQCGNKIERVISGGSGIIFKGSGFYLTDYKNENNNDLKNKNNVSKKNNDDVKGNKQDKTKSKKVKK